MKGLTKALARTPHNLTSRIGMAKKSSDPEFNDYITWDMDLPGDKTDKTSERKFAAVEAASEKMLKDSVVFRDSVSSLLSSGSTFGGSLATLFSPIGSEYNLAAKFPQADVTVRNIGVYQTAMEELRETLAPELELIESRIVQPCKELTEICKKIRKSITKREHKLVDFDRHNNSLNKLREKKEKSLKDEKSLFTVEQDFELAAGEYEHYNELLKQELPVFLQMATRFIDPLFHSFYYMQLNVYYIMLDKVRSFADGKYDLSRTDIETIYYEQRGDAAEQLDDLTITKRTVSTAKMLATHRTASGSISRTSSLASKPSIGAKPGGLGRQTSYGSSKAQEAYGSSPSRVVAAPPPYTSTNSSDSIKKKAPPPPPPLKPKPSYGAAPKLYATALFDYEAQAAGDLSFSAGDRIEVVEKSESAEDWWTGKVNGRQGIFPGNYTQLDA